MTRPAAPRRASIADVARAAGVSVGTVSNVLNRPDRVLPGTRERVEAAIAELSFVRNGSARQLRAGTITTIGAIVLDIANPFFTDVARGIEERLDRDDFTLMVASSDDDPGREQRYLRLFEEHGVQGIIVVPATDDIEHLQAVRRRGTGVVLLDRPSPDPGISSVAVDDVRGGELAAQHLLEQGHTRIAFLNGPHTIRQCADRHEGVVKALAAVGLDPEQALTEITVTSLNAEGGEAAIRGLLESGDQPTAVFCVNDLVALGVLRTLRTENIAVPTDMAVVGYDDVAFAAELSTPLTSVRQPTHELGVRAADLLLTAPDTAEHVMFQPTLVVRTSSARP
ncbi:LacI family DNA-binding transcriptional regulator [Promicromonospora thailandica]|uniref:Transcriptional regulator, LacI family n=1 Tax=Promicromonospora thailandica TaxID=765201 RepID=A0A9X2G1B5_9MICO|nr:LacI family DNA-binding transcriptional regulator [Promicromonospora thailandica]MCP2263578.1 transcriptional regulator, LacI family [Promicromonospora thailandica]BFF19232.1 LacI family DNA-binding transcriptional regulator [Promicromonospora thailandica]